MRSSQQTLLLVAVVAMECVRCAEAAEESQEVLLLQPMKMGKSLLGFIIASVCMRSTRIVVLRILSQSVLKKAQKSSKLAERSGLPSISLRELKDWPRDRQDRKDRPKGHCGKMLSGSPKRKLNS